MGQLNPSLLKQFRYIEMVASLEYALEHTNDFLIDLDHQLIKQENLARKCCWKMNRKTSADAVAKMTKLVSFLKLRDDGTIQN